MPSEEHAKWQVGEFNTQLRGKGLMNA